MQKGRIGAVAMIALLTSACAAGSGGSYVSSSSVPTTGPATNPTTGSAAAATPEPFRQPAIMRGSGIDSVIGVQAGALTNRFGDARIDLAEGDARKLQFVSEGCVLDIYLYPLSANSTPVATHIEARERQGGADADRASCIEAVEQAAQTQ